MKEWSVVHWKYSQDVQNNLGVRAAAQEMEVLDLYPLSSVRDLNPTSPTMQKEALLYGSIHSMLANNFETMLVYRRER